MQTYRVQLPDCDTMAEVHIEGDGGDRLADMRFMASSMASVEVTVPMMLTDLVALHEWLGTVIAEQQAKI